MDKNRLYAVESCKIATCIFWLFRQAYKKKTIPYNVTTLLFSEEASKSATCVGQYTCDMVLLGAMKYFMVNTVTEFFLCGLKYYETR